MLNRKRIGTGLFRILFVAPYLSTPVAMGIIWYWVFDPKLGAINHFLALFGIQGPAWLSNSTLAMPIVAGVNIWQYLGFNMLFFLAGLQAIPKSLYEAAETGRGQQVAPVLEDKHAIAQRDTALCVDHRRDRLVPGVSTPFTY